jgi:hypothetical protein
MSELFAGKRLQFLRSMRFNKPTFFEISLVILIAFACFSLDIGMQSPAWTFPYFSGSGHLVTQGQWLISRSDYALFTSLSDLEKVWFDFSVSQKAEDLVEYNYYGIGFVHVIAFAKLLFPFISSIAALVVLQVIMHCLICLAVMRNVRENHLKFVFIVFYALNPVVLKYVCFSFYYFWQVIPSFFLVLYFLQKKPWGVYLLPVAFILGVSLGVRGTTVLIVLVFLLLCVWRERSAISLVSFGLVLGIKLFLYGGETVPWHTVYIGIGGYENSHGVTLDDGAGFKLFEKKTGISINTDPIYGNFGDPELRQYYGNVLKEEYLSILKESPSLLVSNAIKNTLGGYSVGYFVGHSLLQDMAIILGASFALMLLLFRQFFWFLAIGLSLIPFASFYPPIPAYMYGTYLITVVAFLQMLNPIYNRVRKFLVVFRLKSRYL